VHDKIPDPLCPNEWLREDQWLLLKPVLYRVLNTQGPSNRQSDREFLTALAYLIKTNSTWRNLPPEMGDWHNVYMRFRRWEKTRVWAQLYRGLDENAIEQLRDIVGYAPSTDIINEECNYKSIRERLHEAIKMEVW
jgi:transposase